MKAGSLKNPRWARLAGALWLVAVLAVPASAHRLRPAIVTVSFDGAGAYQLDLVLNPEAVLSGIGCLARRRH